VSRALFLGREIEEPCFARWANSIDWKWPCSVHTTHDLHLPFVQNWIRTCLRLLLLISRGSRHASIIYVYCVPYPQFPFARLLHKLDGCINFYHVVSLLSISNASILSPRLSLLLSQCSSPTVDTHFRLSALRLNSNSPCLLELSPCPAR
jgi:hypothetical protein